MASFSIWSQVAYPEWNGTKYGVINGPWMVWRRMEWDMRMDGRWKGDGVDKIPNENIEMKCNCHVPAIWDIQYMYSPVLRDTPHAKSSSIA
jgi:hypothetical protein